MAGSARKNTLWTLTEVETLLCVTLYVYVIFPDEGHVIASDAGRRYMVSSLMRFFRKCFEEGEGFPAQLTN
ncbi:unnamed protein product [Boreogadus saida]